MHRQATSGLFKGINVQVTMISIIMVTATLCYEAFFTEHLADVLERIRNLVNPFLEWYCVLLVGFYYFL
ncbi:hypothetical protein QEN58_04795 [Halomonas alkaliantarctica]|uniref:Uncharacterized protein n=1 Tax=Halomonas alkaliantarctica TaxID=232346 RepID=A0ABY8LSP3_9GAMM|nr:hypothetical protein [Halomonas alkaliantarctica]WGI26387.1 hypothetical protein QEN58_04795 [Halomonas alkaliantarctica]